MFLCFDALAYILVQSILNVQNLINHNSLAKYIISRNTFSSKSHLFFLKLFIVLKSGLLFQAKNIKPKSDFSLLAIFLLEKV